MSYHNVEVYRCVLCDEVVTTSPHGFSLDQEQLDLKLDDHLANDCRVRAERNPGAEDKVS